MAIKKVKGIKVSKSLSDKFKFDKEGESQIGSGGEDVHVIVGESDIGNDMSLTGQAHFEKRIAETLFGVPQLNGATQTAELQDLIDNAADHEGFIIYLTAPSTTAPFTQGEKFYFCENGVWHQSPFTSSDSDEPDPDDTDGDGIDDVEDPQVTETVSTTGATVQASAAALEIPPNALPAAVDISVEVVDPATVSDAVLDEKTLTSDVITLTPHGQQFAEPVKVTINVSKFIWNPDIYIQSSPGATWELHETPVDVDGNKVSFEVTSFSSYAVVEPPPSQYIVLVYEGDGNYSFRANFGEAIGGFQFTFDAGSAGTITPTAGAQVAEAGWYFTASPSSKTVLAFPFDGREIGAGEVELIRFHASSNYLPTPHSNLLEPIVLSRIDGTRIDMSGFDFDVTQLDNAGSFSGVGDADGDGANDNVDAFPNDPSETQDTDGDGVGDNADDLPNDPSETVDSDGDGVGDNSDWKPNDPAESADTDGDGVGDNADAFPNDASETVDSDNDGVGDNSDWKPNDPAESADSDGDGVGDNADAFPNDALETVDTDGDGTGDNADVFPNDATEDTDTDGDGVGDNLDYAPSDPAITIPPQPPAGSTFVLRVYTDDEVHVPGSTSWDRWGGQLVVDGTDYSDLLSTESEETITLPYDANQVGYSTVDINDIGGDGGIKVEFLHPVYGWQFPVYSMGSMNQSGWPNGAPAGAQNFSDPAHWEGPLPVTFQYLSTDATDFVVRDQQNNVMVSTDDLGSVPAPPMVFFDNADLVVNETHPHNSNQEAYAGWRLMTALAGDVLSIDTSKFTIEDLDDLPANTTVKFYWRMREDNESGGKDDKYITPDGDTSWGRNSGTATNTITIPQEFAAASWYEKPASSFIYLEMDLEDADGNIKQIKNNSVGDTVIYALNENEVEMWSRLNDGLTVDTPVDSSHISLSREKKYDSEGRLFVVEGDTVTFTPPEPVATVKDPYGNDISGPFEAQWRSRAIVDNEYVYHLSSAPWIANFYSASDKPSFSIPELPSPSSWYEFFYIQQKWSNGDHLFPTYGAAYSQILRQTKNEMDYMWLTEPLASFDALWETTEPSWFDDEDSLTNSASMHLRQLYDLYYVAAANNGSLDVSHYDVHFEHRIGDLNSQIAVVDKYFPDTSTSEHHEKYQELVAWASTYENPLTPMMEVLHDASIIKEELVADYTIHALRDYGMYFPENIYGLWQHALDAEPSDQGTWRWWAHNDDGTDPTRLNVDFSSVLSEYPNPADWATAQLNALSEMREDISNEFGGYDEAAFESADYGDYYCYSGWSNYEQKKPISYNSVIDFLTEVSELTPPE